MNPRNKLPQTWGYGLTVDNVNEALPLGLQLVRDRGVPVVSRGIETLEVPGPVMTIYRTPMRRVLFDEQRDANPFFHLIESLWILAGSRTVHLPSMFLQSITQFSDDGMRFHGAYGWRLRNWPEVGPRGEIERYDQLLHAIRILREKPDTRQCVLSIWDPAADLGAITKDVPCNDMIMFSVRDGFLHMTVNNRSNDVIWGAYGANAVQFSMIQEVVAVAAGLEVGYYTQQSNSYHVYPSNPFWQKFLKGQFDGGHVYNPYMNGDVTPWPVAENANEALNVLVDCAALNLAAEQQGTLQHLIHGTARYKSPFFEGVVIPMIEAYTFYKDRNWKRAFDSLGQIQAQDWRAACAAWVLRRKEAYEAQGAK